MERREYLKPSVFGNADKRRQLNSKTLKEKRSIRRTEKFNLQRDLDVQEVKNTIENVPPKKTDKLLDRKYALQKFKEEREAKKKALKETKKPPFIVGIPHHGSSPLLKNVNNDKIKKEPKTTINEVRSKRVTRSTRTGQGNVLKEKPKINEQPKNAKVFKAPPSVKTFPFKDNKSVFTFQAYKAPQSAKKLTSPHTPTVLKRSVQKKPLRCVSSLAKKSHKSPESFHVLDGEVLAEPLNAEPIDEQVHDGEAITASQASVVKNETPVIVSPLLPEGSVKEQDEKVIDSKGEDNELVREVAFQHSRLQAETTRLLELADQWQALALREKLPQEVEDEIDSLVGQTRLLTSDKFQQFRRLVVQYEEKTGTHPVTLDDLNGFWDMVYLQVESLDKKYAALDALRNNNWVRPEPASRKRRRPGKALPKTEKSEKPCPTLTSPRGVQKIQTPTTDLKPVISSVLLSRKRTRSNSPSPYIAMRLSGVGRTPNFTAKLPVVADGTPKNILAHQTKNKRTLKSNLDEQPEQMGKHLCQSSSVEIKNEGEVLTVAEELFGPSTQTPRRSTRLQSKIQATPSTCTACESVSCERTRRLSRSIPRSNSKRSRRSEKQDLSPANDFLMSKTESGVTDPKEAEINNPSTSRIRFSLRPSILTVNENNNVNEIPKKTKKKKQSSVCTASTSIAEQGTEGDRTRRSTRQSRKVTFESGPEEKVSFKLPATPYRKSQADS